MGSGSARWTSGPYISWNSHATFNSWLPWGSHTARVTPGAFGARWPNQAPVSRKSSRPSGANWARHPLRSWSTWSAIFARFSRRAPLSKRTQQSRNPFFSRYSSRTCGTWISRLSNVSWLTGRSWKTHFSSLSAKPWKAVLSRITWSSRRTHVSRWS